MPRHTTGYLFKRGNNFYVSWTVNGKVFSKSLRDEQGKPITTRREAELAQVKLMAAFVAGDEADALQAIAVKLEGRKAEIARLTDQQNPPLAIGQAWQAFFASPNRPDSGTETLYQYECQWSAFAEWMKEKHADRPTLRDVTKDLAEEYAANLNGVGLSPNTYNKHLNLLTLVFRVLKHKAKLTDNHWEVIQRKRLATHSRRELTMDELKKVCQSAEGELKVLLALGIYCGLRLGDCATLRWAEVDLRLGIIRRVPNKTARSKPDKPVLVPIHPTLRELLNQLNSAENRSEYVLPKMASLYRDRSDLVTDIVQKHFISCGIRPHKTGTGKDGKRAIIEVGFHSLRHTFVSLCRASDVPLAVVESLVGHSNPAMTRYYTHTGELAAGRAVAALPSLTKKDDEPKVTPDVFDTEVIFRKAVEVAQAMTSQTWEAKRQELLNILGTLGDKLP